MRVAFFLTANGDADHGYLQADLLIRSIRRTMPGVHITHLSDERSPAVPTADKVIRGPAGPLSVLRPSLYSSLKGDDFLFLDTDIVVQKDVRHVFDERFNLALADRNWPGGAARDDSAERNGWIYNLGVAFSCSPDFWKEVYDGVRKLPLVPRNKGDLAQTSFFADQQIANDVVRNGGYKVVSLPGELYNYPPEVAGGDERYMADAYIVHYKGVQRKPLLLARFRADNARAQAAPVPEPPTSVGLNPVPEPTPAVAKEPAPCPRSVAVYIGYDPRQPLAYNVVAHSVASRASVPTAITRLQLSQLPIKRKGLTEFTFSRFLVPYLSGYEGWSIFMDADVVCLGDVAELLALAQANPPACVHVVKNEHPKLRYEWASLMVFDNARCRHLTPEFVEDAQNGMFDLKWAMPHGIGGLPKEWNHLVGYDAPAPNRKLIHYTQGVPCWPETAECDMAGDWHAERARMGSTVSFEVLMGSSVHVKHMKKAAGR